MGDNSFSYKKSKFYDWIINTFSDYYNFNR